MENEELNRRVTFLENFIRSIAGNTTIPHDVEQAFRSRLEIGELARLRASTKTAASETQAVSEGGAASYNVAKPPDGFREFVVGGSTLYIPYYT